VSEEATGRVDTPHRNATDPPAAVKQRLLSRRRELAARARAVESDLEQKDVTVSGNWCERASEQANDEVLGAIGVTDARELADIDTALRRLELGTYGPCTLCGRHISAERLRALPHAEYCQRCALVHEAKHGTAR
jgi:DnaK suppressor protein